MLQRYVKPSEQESYRRRVRFLLVLLLAMLCGFLVRLYQTNIVSGEKYAEISENNFLTPRKLRAKRGGIVDRMARSLAESRLSFTFSISRFKNKPEVLRKTLERLGRELNCDVRRLYRRLEQLPLRWSKLMVAENVSLERAAPILERKGDYPGLVVEESFSRFYPYGKDASHVTGYVGQIHAEEWAELKAAGYDKDDEVALAGIEKTYEGRLRGRKGEEVVLQDARGRYTESYLKKPSQPGDDVVLTLDAELQRFVSSAMEGKQGVAIVMRPRDGALLALVSKPDYDPSDVWGSVRGGDASLFNKAIQGVYTPGSTFKPIVALAILEEGIEASAEVECNGSYFLPGWNRPFNCNVVSGHGSVDLHRALHVSCNVYFYEMARRVGAGAIIKRARKLGLGDLTGIDLPGERTGLLPGEQSERMAPGEVIQLGIGQATLAVTPLEMLVGYCTLINGGKKVHPYLVSRISDADGDVIYEHAVSEEAVTVRAEDRERIMSALVDAVNKEGGTAFQVGFPRKWKVAGKTGTAQTQHEMTDAWFICFAPYDDPEVSVLVLVEQSGHGGEVAAPIARSILDHYFQGVGEK